MFPKIKSSLQTNMGSKSNYLSYLKDNWLNVETQVVDHKLDMDQVCTFYQDQPFLKQLKQKHPQINVHVQSNKIKKISNGMYIGQLNQDQKPHGNGIIRYDDGSYLQAKFSNGKANGKGLMLYPQNHYYVGQFVDNNFDGRGQFHTPFMSYIGQFKDNKFHGRGQLTMIQKNSVFDGFMEGGYMKQGTLKWQIKPQRKNSQIKTQKFKYTGKFKDNKFDDDNAQLVSNLGTYTGGFKNGLKQGKGRFQFVQKYQYIGEYQNNVKSGFGTLYNPQSSKNGDKEQLEFNELQKNITYRGQFKNNLPHGKGQIYQESIKSLKQAQYQEGIYKQTLNYIKN